MTKATEFSILSIVLQTVSTYHSSMYGYYHDRDQRYYDQPDSYNYDWPKRHIRKLLPHRNRIRHIDDRYRMDTDISAGCECSCNDCVLPKLCCVPTCAACAVHTDVLYIPYPVPIIVTMPSVEPKKPSTTKPTTKSTTHTKSTRLTTKFTTIPSTKPPTVPTIETTTVRPWEPCSTYSPTLLTSAAEPTVRIRPTLSSTVKPDRRLTLPPGAEELVNMALLSEGNIARIDYDDNSLIRSTQPPRVTKQMHCPRISKCVYHGKYQGLMPNRRSNYGRGRTSDWFSNIERSLRRTTRDWLPKYGIVSIPDHLARFFVEDIPQYDTNDIR